LFPVDDQVPSGKTKGMGAVEPTKSRLRSFLGDGKAIDPQRNDGSSPIADLFPETTVLFSDISGFTAWSSVREPTQVFTLLENIYGTFDATLLPNVVFSRSRPSVTPMLLSRAFQSLARITRFAW
jgi:hypothetical protein